MFVIERLPLSAVLCDAIHFVKAGVGPVCIMKKKSSIDIKMFFCGFLFNFACLNSREIRCTFLICGSRYEMGLIKTLQSVSAYKIIFVLL